MYHIFLIHSSVNRLFHFLAFVIHCSATMNIGVHMPFFFNFILFLNFTELY